MSNKEESFNDDLNNLYVIKRAIFARTPNDLGLIFFDIGCYTIDIMPPVICSTDYYIYSVVHNSGHIVDFKTEQLFTGFKHKNKTYDEKWSIIEVCELIQYLNRILKIYAFT